MVIQEGSALLSRTRSLRSSRPTTRGRRRDEASERWLGIGLIFPACVVLLLVLALPTAFAFVYSVLDLHFIKPHGFGGLTNWRRVVFQASLVPLLIRTAVFVTGSVLLTLAASMPIAVFLDRVTQRKSLALQLLVIIPWVLSAIVAALLFRWTVLENLGIVAYVEAHLGHQFDPLISPLGAMVSMIVVASWRTVGFAVLLLLAGLKSVDSEIYEAARVDGASRRQEFWYVVLPGIRTQLTIVTVVLMMSNLNNVEIPLAVTGGGPGQSTTILPLRIYELAFNNFDFGGATALASGAILLNVVLVFVYMRLTRWRA